MKPGIFVIALLIPFGSFCLNSQNTKKISQDRFEELRQQMVDRQIKARGITDPKIIQAMLKVPRHKFVPPSERKSAYEDSPLPIGYDQTISQPYIVAYMTEKLDLKSNDKVLEIGTGSGYQAAILSELAKEVYTIEIIEPLCITAREMLRELNYTNVSGKCDDGFRGWPEHAPFDAIIMTAAPQKIPDPLLEQLKIGGRLIAPIGGFFQELTLVTKNPDGTLSREKLIPVRFVPMTGEADSE